MRVGQVGETAHTILAPPPARQAWRGAAPLRDTPAVTDSPGRYATAAHRNDRARLRSFPQHPPGSKTSAHLRIPAGNGFNDSMQALSVGLPGREKSRERLSSHKSRGGIQTTEPSG